MWQSNPTAGLRFFIARSRSWGFDMVASFPPREPSPECTNPQKCLCCCCCCRERPQPGFNLLHWALGWGIGMVLGTVIAQAVFKPWYVKARGYEQTPVPVERSEQASPESRGTDLVFVPRTCTGAEIEPCVPGGDWVCAGSDCVEGDRRASGGSDNSPSGDPSDCGVDQPCGNW